MEGTSQHEYQILSAPYFLVRWKYNSFNAIIIYFSEWSGKGTFTMDTLVTFKLTNDKTGTILKLEHFGFVGAKNCMTCLILEFGWKKQIVKRFNSILGEINSW